MRDETEVEFKVTTDLTQLSNGGIEANFEAVRAWLNENLAPYRTMAVTEDNIRDARSYRAAVRKVKDSIDQSRKAVKIAAMAPYAQFEARCKELTGLCDEAAAALDGQIKAIEDAERSEKLRRLLDFYQAEVNSEERDFLPFESLIRRAWSNKGYAVERAQQDIREAAQRMRGDLAAIRVAGGADADYLIGYYKGTRDLADAMRKLEELKAMRARAQKKLEETEEAAAGPFEADPDDVYEAQVRVRFEVECSERQLAALGNYMKKHGIRYKRAE